MSIKIATPHQFFESDVGFMARNFVQHEDGTESRMGNKGGALWHMAHQMNHLLGRHPRPVFSKAWPQGSMYAFSKDPIARWRYYDSTENGFNSTMHVVGMPRQNEETDCYAGQWSGSDIYVAGQVGNTHNKAAGAVTFFTDAFYTQVDIYRGVSNKVQIEDGMTTLGGMGVLSINVQERELPFLDTSDHRYASTDLAGFGKLITTEAPESLRATMHAIRTTMLPVVGSWASIGDDARPASSSAFGIVVSGAGFVNLLDQTHSSRSATSPGHNTNMQYAGWGLDDDIPVVCQVLAEATTNDGTVRFEGPDHIASNTTDITVTGGGGLAWYGDSTNTIQLNARADPSDLTTTEQNKIDPLAEVNSGGTLYIHGWRCEMTTPS